MLRGCLRGALALALMGAGVGEGRAWDWTGQQAASTWSGPYAGFHLGGALFGIHGGYNLQAGRIVLGFEADASKTFFKGRSDDTGTAVFDVNAATGSIFDESNWLVGVRGRTGIASGDFLRSGQRKNGSPVAASCRLPSKTPCPPVARRPGTRTLHQEHSTTG